MRKRKLLTITAVLAAGLCICWGATAFADPPNTTGVQPPDAGKITTPTPPNTFGPRMSALPDSLGAPVETTVEGTVVDIIDLDQGATPRDGNHVFEGIATNGYYRPWYQGTTAPYYTRDQIADYCTTTALGAWQMNKFHIGVYCTVAGAQSWTVTFHNCTGAGGDYPSTANKVGTATVTFTATTVPAGYTMEADISATPISFSSKYAQWSGRGLPPER